MLVSSLPSLIINFPLLEGFSGGSARKESACNAGDLGSIPGLGRSPGEGKGYPLQYSCLENSMDCAVHGVPKSQTLLIDFHFTSPTWRGFQYLQNSSKILCVSNDGEPGPCPSAALDCLFLPSLASPPFPN